MDVSVVVPTKDRARKLERCLAALDRQGIELIVVDDGSQDAERVAALASAAGAKLVRLGGAGPAAARNAGAAAAGGAVVCFTDDDCEPRPGWAAALAAPILAGRARCTAGRTLAAADASAADRAWQAIVDCLQEAGTAAGSPSPGFAASCNLGCSRELLGELSFDESFPTAAGEDRDWAARATAEGAPPAYAAEALVVHRPELDARSFLRQQYRYGRGSARYRAAAQDRRLGSPGFYLRLLRAGFAAGPLAGALVCAAQLATLAGIAVERFKR
jgi:glycosyltransferase involved in cell wall biosynthesis